MTLSRLILFAVLGVGACSNSEPQQQPAAKPAAQPSATKDPATARKLVAAGAAVIDVRSPEEYAEGHVPNAINIPVSELSARLAEVDKLVAGDKTRPVVVYCAAGGRAAKAKAQLDAVGYAQVINGGGVDDLQ